MVSYRTDGEITASSAIKGGSVYVGTLKGTLYAFEARTGVIRWTSEAGRAILSTPVIDGKGNVYVGTRNGTIAAYASMAPGETGKLLWQESLPGEVRTSPVLDENGHLYVACGDGTIAVFRTDLPPETVSTGYSPTPSPLLGTNADIASLETDTGAISVTGSVYSVSVTDAVYEIRVTVTSQDPKAKITIDGTATDTGVPHVVSVNHDSVSVPIRIVSEDGNHTNLYTLQIIRGKLLGIHFVEAEPLRLEVGQSMQLHVQAEYDNGLTADITGLCAYTISSDAVTIDSSGIMTGINANEAAITAKYGVKTATAHVEVE